VGRDDDDPVTQINVELDASKLDEITITESGESPADALRLPSSSDPSPADSEPHTLEPQTLEPGMSVRGLGPISTSMPGSAPATGAKPTQASPKAPAVPAGEDDDDERTTRSIESHLLEVYEKERAAKARAQLPPIVITPSEPFRVTASGVVSEMPRSVPRRPAPIPAAGRPAMESEPDISEVITARGGPETIPDDDVEDAEDETVTDAMRSPLLASKAKQLEAEGARVEDDAEEQIVSDSDGEEETSTSQKVRAVVAAAFAATAESLPGTTRGLVGIEELDAKAAAGGTVRMYFDPHTKKASPFADTEQSFPTVPPLPHNVGASPALPAFPAPAPLPVIAPPPVVPAALETTRAGRPRKRRRGRILFLFLFFFAVGAGGVFYRDRLPARITRYLPARLLPAAPVAAAPQSVAPMPSEVPSSEPSAAASASASASPSASASTSTMSPSASPSASAAPSASASAAGSARGKKPPRPPAPPPPPIKREKPRPSGDDHGF
jgi:hypothetical protein